MSHQLTLGELFAGYGGLGLAVEEVFNARLAWYAEFDPSASKIMAHHWPDLTNYGDVTAVDWASVPPVDIISGGSPCQDLSLAGARRGMTQGTRSNLWESMREAIATIKPTYVVWENVRGALSAHATSASDVEHGDGPVGGATTGHLRALGRVLGDLADLGYDCEWHGLRASDIGAPHQRFRVFLLGTRRGAPADCVSGGRWWRREAQLTWSSAHATGDDPRGGDRRPPAPDTSGATIWEQPGGTPAEEARPNDSDRSRDHRGERPHPDRRSTATDTAGNGRDKGRAEPTRIQRRHDAAQCGPAVPPDTHRGDDAGRIQDQERGTLGRDAATRPGGGRIEWGPYTPAIARWEALRGAAPAPTELTAKGKQRLSARFCEWLMGLTPGWVTDVPISRNDQLKALGNGVVPQQAAAALRIMLSRSNRSGFFTPQETP